MRPTGRHAIFFGVLSFAATAAFIAQSCRPQAEDSIVRSADSGAQGAKVSIKRSKTGANTYEVRYFHDNRIADGQKLYLKWDVISNYSDTAVNCSRLNRSAAVTHKEDRASKQFGGFDIDVPGGLFNKCNAGDADGRKISLACQHSGDWNGPKRIEGCVYSDVGQTQLIGSGFGLPKANGQVEKGFGLDATVAIEDIDEVVNYGKVCANRLGALPAFDCRDGQTIPITKDGVEIPFDQNTPGQKCDKPPYLGLGDQGQCVPYTRIGRLDSGNPDVDTVYVCRRYNIGDVDSADTSKVVSRWPADKAWHNDVAIIQHNRKSGETCWYQALSGFQGGRPLSTWRVPPPNEDDLPADVKAKNETLPPLERAMTATDFWIRPDDPGTVEAGFACVKCHDSDPFMMSPYVAQMKETIGGLDQYFLPCDPSKPGQVNKRICKNAAGQGKYSMVSKRHQPPNWKVSFTVAPKDPSARECVTCHRIGTHNTCQTWAKDSVGMTKFMGQYRTDLSTNFPNNHWMPVRPGAQPHAYADQAAWDADMQKSATALLECCSLYRGLPGTQTDFDNKCEATQVITLPDTGTDVPPAGGKITLKTAADTAIPDGDPNGVTIPLTTDGTAAEQTVRSLTAHIVVKHPYIGNIKIVLSHADQTAVLYDGFNAEIPAMANLDLTLQSSTEASPLLPFVGQRSGGAWEIKAIDATKHDKGSVTGVELNLTIGD